MIGQTLSHYRIVEKLGEGGMGILYRARDTRLDRDVAIKVLRPEALGDAARRRRFAQEAKAASALNHPHIVAVYDVGHVPVDGHGRGLHRHGVPRGPQPRPGDGGAAPGPGRGARLRRPDRRRSRGRPRGRASCTGT